MNYVESFDFFGIPAKQIPCTPGSGAPTNTTEGVVGCLYMDTDTGAVYKCTAVSDSTYTWVEFGTDEEGSIRDVAVTLATATKIDNGTDLNDLTTYGNYKVMAASAAKSLVNCPVTIAFIMRVGSPAPGVANYFYQEIITLEGTKYYRFCRPGTDALAWERWRQTFDSRTPIPAQFGGMGMDTASCLSEAAHLSCVQQFVSRMNSNATIIGMDNTTFITPSGLPKKPVNKNKVNANIEYNNYSTAYDLLRLLVAARHTPTVYKMMGADEIVYFVNGEYYTVAHTVCGSTAWQTWENEHGYTILAAKSGSLAGSLGEIGDSGIYNMAMLVKDANGDIYAASVMGLNNTSADKAVCHTIIHDLISGSGETDAIGEANSRTYPVGMAVAKLTASGTFDDDIEALASGTFYNADAVRAAASTTKIMTAITAVPFMGNHDCSVSYDDIVGGSGITLEAGDTISTPDALGLMLGVSDNTLATLLARDCGTRMVGTTTTPEVDLNGIVKSVNGQIPDENGNVSIDIPEAGGDTNYNPVAKTDDMTQPVGVDADGRLWVAPIGGDDTTDTPVVPGSHAIVWDLVNVTSSNNAVSISDGAALITVLTAADGYTLGDVTITMGGEVLTGVWNADTATVTIASVTGDVIISCAGAEQTGPVDTSPVIVQYDTGYKAWTAGELTSVESVKVAASGICITEIYRFETDIEAIKASTYYDATNDYLSMSNVVNAIYYYTPSLKTRAEGYSISGNHTKIVRFRGEQVYEYHTNNCTSLTSDPAEKLCGCVRYFTNGLYNDGISFTLATLDVDDSYVYWNGTGNAILPKGVRHGDIIFAGKNTQYYGMANIDGTLPGAGTSTVSGLSFDDDYAMDYGIAVAGIVTEEAEETEVEIDKGYAAVIEEAKNAWLTEANGNIDKIPLLIHTDQHGNFNKALFDFIDEIVDWYDVGKVINLGDTVNDYGDASNLLSCSALVQYVESMKSVPYSKRIEVYGNHDATGGGSGMTPQNHLYKYFRNIYARRADNYGNFVVHDDNYNVKYLAVSGFAFDSDLGGYSHYIINPDSINWIIAELEKVDGYDVIILSHVPLNQSDVPLIDPTTGENAQSTATGLPFKKLDGLWGGRKDKTAGTFTDEYGNEYAYDFTKCNGELLCSLHGHKHEDSYYYTDGTLLSVSFDAYYISPKAIHFVIVDRENRRLNVWKVDDTPQYQNYQIPLDAITE